MHRRARRMEMAKETDSEEAMSCNVRKEEEKERGNGNKFHGDR